ncbi:MAG TPA: hypothetical protein VMD91_17280 [Candidatus Sulfotelmatobacter sp.]|nr:hypothetical protein [Candidatus Sulfotelmatobacter sp.]
MSVSSVSSGSLPDPAAYTYTPSLPTGLAYGDAAAPGASSSSSSGSSSTSSSTSSTGNAQTISPYVAEYSTLQEDDAAELLQVSLDSPTDATSNVESVLAQAAAYQAQQNAAQSQAAAATAQSAIQSGTSSSSSSSTVSGPLDIPSYESIISQSDQDGYNAINDAFNIGTGTSSSGTTNSYASMATLLGLGATGTGSAIDTTA